MIREFRAQFSLCPRNTIPTRLIVNKWIKNFRETTSAVKKKSPRQPAMVRTLENQDHMRDAILTRPTYLGRKQAQAFGISRRSFHRMVMEMHFHSYKIVQYAMTVRCEIAE